MERVGVRYFRRRSRLVTSLASGDPVHRLDPRERAALRAVERGAILRACLAGALSSVVAAGAEVAAAPLLGSDPDGAGWAQLLRFWTVVGGATLLASVAEIAFLYWDSLRSVHELAVRAGLDLFGGGDERERRAVAGALARAALELPNPAARLFGVDPRREASRARLLAASLLYKAKISVTNFLLKALVRRMLGRAALRTALLPFVAVPVTAAWNGVVSWMVLREARIRAMGPSAMRAMAQSILAGSPLSAEGRLAAVRAVGSAIVRKRDLHPNLAWLLVEVTRRCAELPGAELDDVPAFLASLPTLAPSEQTVALRLLEVAAIADGRLTGSEKRLVAQAQAAAGRPVELASVERLRKAFVRGDPWDEPASACPLPERLR